MRTEQISIKLSPTELGHIDYLVEKGLYESRSEFIRFAVKSQTEKHAQDVEQFLVKPRAEETSDNGIVMGFVIGVGVFGLSRSDFEKLIAQGRKTQIKILGVLKIDKGVTAEMIGKAVSSCKVYGKIIAEKAVLDALAALEGN